MSAAPSARRQSDAERDSHRELAVAIGAMAGIGMTPPEIRRHLLRTVTATSQDTETFHFPTLCAIGAAAVLYLAWKDDQQWD